MLAVGLLAVGTTAFSVWGERLIALYLHEGSETGDLVATAAYGASYLRVMLWGLAPFAVQQVYATTLRECGETLVPMKAGLIAAVPDLALGVLLLLSKGGAISERFSVLYSLLNCNYLPLQQALLPPTPHSPRRS